MHRRFTERAEHGEGGVRSAVEALDAMWLSIRDLRSAAGLIMGTLSSRDEEVQDHVSRFYHESTTLLSDAIRHVFAEDLGQLAVPPERMAVLVRIVLEGLIVELAQAQSEADVALVDRAYGDLRQLFEQFVLLGEGGSQLDDLTMEPIPLPW
jgi:hypothetical protein